MFRAIRDKQYKTNLLPYLSGSDSRWHILFIVFKKSLSTYAEWNNKLNSLTQSSNTMISTSLIYHIYQNIQPLLWFTSSESIGY